METSMFTHVIDNMQVMISKTLPCYYFNHVHYTTAQTGVQLRVAKSIEIALDGRSLYICGKRSDAICYYYVRRLVGIFILDQRPTVGRNN